MARAADDVDFKALSVLIVGGRPANVQVLRTALSMLAIRDVVAAPDARSGIDRLLRQKFSAVFCDATVGAIERMPFAVAARRLPGIVAPLAPLFIVASNMRRRDVEAARDCGVTDVLVRPLSPATLARKLRQAIRQPRPFILAGGFFGPDRRSSKRDRRAAARGNDRRSRTVAKVKLESGTVTLPDENTDTAYF